MATHVMVALDKLAFVEQGVHRMHPGEVQLEKVIRCRLVDGNAGPCRIIWACSTLIMVLPITSRESSGCWGWRLKVRGKWSTKPFHDALVRLAIPESFDYLLDILVSRERLEDLLGDVILYPHLLYLLDKFLFGMLDVNFVYAFNIFCTVRTPLTRCSSVTLLSISSNCPP